MSAPTPRLRMFAGPNGSGKTTVKQGLQRPPSWFGNYINPDEIEKSIRETGFYSVTEIGLQLTQLDLESHFANSTLLKSQGVAPSKVEIRGGAIHLDPVAVNSYHASVIADFLRRKLMQALQSFSFETVMSSPDKVDLLAEAQRL